MRRILSPLFAVLCLIFLTLPAVVAQDMAMEGGGTSNDTFTAYWNGEAYTEKKDPLKRFVHYPLTDADGDGLVALKPLPYIKGTSTVGDLSHVTDFDIETNLLKLGLTREDMLAQIDLAFASDSDLAETGRMAKENVSVGRYLAAADIMTGRFVDVVYWCGPETAPVKYPWVMIIPILLDCNGGTDDVFVATRLASVGFISTGTGQREPEFLDAEFLSTGINTVDATLATTKHALGVGSHTHHFAAKTLTQKSWNLAFNLTGISSSGGRDTGWGSWSMAATEVLDFEKGDAFFYTKGEEFNRSRSYALTLSATTRSTFRMDIETNEFTTGGWTIKAVPSTVSGIQPWHVHLDLGLGKRFQCESMKIPDRLTAGYKSQTYPDAGTKHNITLATSSAAAHKHTEFKCTLFDTGVAYLDFQFSGIPSFTNVAIDFGDAEDKVASADVSQGDRATEHYRTFVLTPHVAALPFNATMGMAKRGQFVVADADPFLPDGNPFVLHAAHYADARGNTTLRTSSSFLVEHFSKMEVAQWKGHDNPDTTYRWRHEPDSGCTLTECWESGAVGTRVTHDTSAFNRYFWAIKADELVLGRDTVCMLKHSLGNCA